MSVISELHEESFPCMVENFSRANLAQTFIFTTLVWLALSVGVWLLRKKRVLRR